MTRRGTGLFLSVIILLAGQVFCLAQTNDTSPNFQEVYDLIHQHATGLSDTELNRDAVQGLIGTLNPRVMLITNSTSTNSADGGRRISQARFFEGDIAYLRVSSVANGLPNAVRSMQRQMAATNKISGIILDLRYTDGTDYEAAAATADLFVGKSEPLLSWNGHSVSSHEKSDALSMPVAVLVNRQTAGASEALAAAMRETGSGLIIGSRTAGQAMVGQDFPLKNGDELRIASAPVMLADGTKLSFDGIKPDIDVTVSVEDERAFYADAFLEMSKTNPVAGASTNRVGTNGSADRVLFNEAELVREHKAGENSDEETAKRPPEPHVPVVSDPALARALDLLKGLAVVRESHS